MRSSKISWFVSGEQINYLPKPKAEANNIDLRDQFWKKKVCYMCRFVVLPKKCIAFFKSLLLLPLLLQQLPILKGHMVTTYGQMQNVFVYKCNYWLLWKCSCFVKRYSWHVQYKCNETLSIEWNIYKYFVIENSLRLILFQLESSLHLEHIAENILL